MKTTKNINLRIRKSAVSLRVQEIGKWLSISSAVILVLFLILYITSFFYLSFSALKYKNTQKKIDQYIQIINEKRSAEAIFVSSTSKLQYINSIITSEFPYPSILKDLFSFVPPGINLNSININSQGLATFNFTASSSAILDNFIDGFSKKDVLEHKYKNITASSTNRLENGSFRVFVNMVINNDNFNE